MEDLDCGRLTGKILHWKYRQTHTTVCQNSHPSIQRGLRTSRGPDSPILPLRATTEGVLFFSLRLRLNIRIQDRSDDPAQCTVHMRDDEKEYLSGIRCTPWPGQTPRAVSIALIHSHSHWHPVHVLSFAHAHDPRPFLSVSLQPLSGGGKGRERFVLIRPS